MFKDLSKFSTHVKILGIAYIYLYFQTLIFNIYFHFFRSYIIYSIIYILLQRFTSFKRRKKLSLVMDLSSFVFLKFICLARNCTNIYKTVTSLFFIFYYCIEFNFLFNSKSMRNNFQDSLSPTFKYLQKQQESWLSQFIQNYPNHDFKKYLFIIYCKIY